MSDATCSPKAFIFDCDGTILQSMDMWLRASPALLKTYGFDTTVEDFEEFEPLGVRDECAGYREKWSLKKSVDEIYDDLMAIVLNGYAHEVRMRPGARDFIESVAQAGIPMAIATSTPVHAVSLGLESNGLLDYFPVIVSTGETGTSKRQPDVYNLALERLSEYADLGEVEHSDVWVFEDAVFGLMSSGSAGYRRVGIYDFEGRCDRADVQANCEIFTDSYPELSLDDILSFGD